jgi:hypothetical protein
MSGWIEFVCICTVNIGVTVHCPTTLCQKRRRHYCIIYTYHTFGIQMAPFGMW